MNGATASAWDFWRPVVVIAAVIGVLGILGAAGFTTATLIVIVLVWGLPVAVGYRIGVSKDSWVPLLLAVFLGWVGVLVALVIPGAGKRCPFCDESIRHRATVCRFCDRSL